MTTVINKKTHRGPYVDIGRTRERFHFGNPFSHEPNSLAMVIVATREIAVACFNQWIRGIAFHDVEPERRQWILDNLHTLNGQVLGCYCKPLACHGDVYVELLREWNEDLPTVTPATPITDFHAQGYEWLSNFSPCPILFEGILYPSAEHAYQAAKTPSLDHRNLIASLPTGAAAKKAGKNVPLRPDWNDDTKVQVMESILRIKFSQDPWKGLLLSTGTRVLIEENRWGDKFWGMTPGPNGVLQGANFLGRLLMVIRGDMAPPKYYAGIGASEREKGTPPPDDIKALATRLGRAYEYAGWTLNSGGASGMDMAFEWDVARKQVFRPRGDTRADAMPPPSQELWEEADRLVRPYAPHIDRMSPHVKDLFRRNMFQILGADLQTPVRFVVYWAIEQRGVITGGTRMAVYLARDYGIPCENLYFPEVRERALAFLAKRGC